jgi:hypothetical protein
MATRTQRKVIVFHRPFVLKGIDRGLPPGRYETVTDEELIEGLSFPVYRRVSTVIFVPAHQASSIEMVTIDPSDLQAAQERDAAAHHLSAVAASPQAADRGTKAVLKEGAVGDDGQND